jgi:hypothetical protein
LCCLLWIGARPLPIGHGGRIFLSSAVWKLGLTFSMSSTRGNFCRSVLFVWVHDGIMSGS